MCSVDADVDGCVGMDRHGYGVSSRGWRGHDGVWEEWEGGAWHSGDVIGIHLQLGGSSSTPSPHPTPHAPHSSSFSSSASHPPNPLLPSPLATLLTAQRATIFHMGSSLTLYRNGRPLGVAFTDLLRASAYFPALSLYYGAEVEVRFGPGGWAWVPEEVAGGWWPPREGEGGRAGRVELARRGLLHVGEGAGGEGHGGLVMNPRHVQLEREREKEKEEEEREKERRAKEREREKERERSERMEKGREKEQRTRDSLAARRAGGAALQVH